MSSTLGTALRRNAKIQIRGFRSNDVASCLHWLPLPQGLQTVPAVVLAADPPLRWANNGKRHPLSVLLARWGAMLVLQTRVSRADAEHGLSPVTNRCLEYKGKQFSDEARRKRITKVINLHINSFTREHRNSSPCPNIYSHLSLPR